MRIRHAAAEDFPTVKILWDALYAHQREHGMRLSVPADGFEAWQASMTPLLGRFATVVLAEDEQGEGAGFISCRLRTLPPYFGAQVVGAIGEVYVRDDCRGTGLGRQMLDATIEWCRAQGVMRVELQVLAGNPEAVRFYRGLGWHEELVQMVWDNGPA